MRQVPYFTDVDETMPSRVGQALRSLALVVADEPEVGGLRQRCCPAATQASFEARDRIGAEIHRRIRSAGGPEPTARGRGAGDDVLRCAGERGQRRFTSTRSPTASATWSV